MEQPVMEQESSTIEHKIYDLHSHTNASDGQLTPEQLVERAIEMGVSVLAITDHDSTDGIAPAREYINQQNYELQLISGVEISTLWENIEIHIVGLNMDITHPALVTLLKSQSESRYIRGQEMGRRLAKSGIENAWEGACALADGGQVTRGHFAQFLINTGVASDFPKVFKKYLAKGKIGYVPPTWCTIEESIRAIQAAGGQAVIAHPARYGLSNKWLKRLVEHFKSVNGDAMEVAQCQQAPNERQYLAQLALEHSLKASLGSDFHRPCSWIELGRKMWLPADVTPVWQDWSQGIA